MELYFHDSLPKRAAMVIRICGLPIAPMATVAASSAASSSAPRTSIGVTAWAPAS